MSLREILQRLGNFGKELDIVVLDDARETEYLLVKLRGDWNGAQAFEGIEQSVSEALEAVAVLDDAIALDVVENLANVLGSELVVIEEFDEASDGALEVDVVLPERVVGVDEESLGHASYEQ